MNKNCQINRDEDRYAFIANRSKGTEQDGHFFTCVVTTGIFCKPSCRARVPNYENVRFVETPRQARSAGFRPCKKCRPEGSPTAVSIIEIANYIEQHTDEKLSLAELAEKAHLSASHFQRTFKKLIGVSPKQYQIAKREEKLKAGLKERKSITEALYEAGFPTPTAAYQQTQKGLGMSLGKYRKDGQHEVIYYTGHKTSLGLLLLAATKKGICFAQFGPSKDALCAQLQAEFPKAELRESLAPPQEQMRLWIDALETYLEQGGPAPDLPLDIRGTAFQMKVWEFLKTIPPGEPITYSQLADGIGNPKAVRAVASACARNRIGVLIPCHRVIRGDGSLGGYRWGLERKKALLQLERNEND